MGALFHRGRDLPVIAKARGIWLEDTAGRRYLDAASGAMVVNVGHGAEEITAAIAEQEARVAYVHAAAFTTDITETYADRLAARLPMRGPTVYPVSGGAEAVETALKVARAYHLAQGSPDRTRVIGRRMSYHGNTRGALDAGDRAALREPYLPWLGLAGRAPEVNEYRCPNPGHPKGCADWHAGALEDEILRLGAPTVAAFIAEPIGGAASGACVPPDGYWAGISDVCRRHDVVVIADEVMTGFGRTGAWFASEHFDLEPDVMTMAKGAASGYWPLGICAFSERLRETIDAGPGLIHGFTFSHHPVGAAAGLAVMERIERLGLTDSATARGDQLMNGLRGELEGHPHIGDIRGKGLLVAVELVADTAAKRPFPRSDHVAERVGAVARDLGLVVYPSTGCADGLNGDAILIGPPLIITEDEVSELIRLVALTVERSL